VKHRAISKTLLPCLFYFVFLVVETSYGQDVLYGMTQNGGAFDNGVPYQIMSDGTSFLSFRDFDGVIGGRPGDGAKFTQLSNRSGVLGAFEMFKPQGLFIGLTESGKRNSDFEYGVRVQIKAGEGGLLQTPSGFKINPATGTHPTGGLLEFFNGRLYGVMSQNGQHGGGTLFSTTEVLNPKITVLASFDGANTGKSPRGTPVTGRNGKLYGITEFGGIHDQGVIYSFDIISKIQQSLIKLVDFNGVEKGANPTGSLALGSDGRLYGTTKNGGVYGYGVVFSVLPDGTNYLKHIDLNGTATGSHPKGALTLFSDGHLYGMTSSGGAYGFGTIFRVSVDGTFVKIYDFDGINGKSPVGDLLVNTSGNKMFGTTYAGGQSDGGVLFQLTNGTQFMKLYDFTVQSGSNPVGSLVMERNQFVLNVEPITNAVVSSVPFTPVVYTSSNMPVYFASSDTSVVAVRDNKLVFKTSGHSTLSAFQLGNHEALPTWFSTTILVKKAPQSITFDAVPAKIFGNAPFLITAASSSGLPVSFSSSNTSVATVSGNTISIKGAGHATITAYQTGTNEYDIAPQVEQHLFVDRAAQTIAFNPPTVRTCCDSFVLTGTSSVGAEVLFKSEDQERISVWSTTATPKNLGKVDIIAYHPGSTNYKPAELRIPIEIVKGEQSIHFNINSRQYKVGDYPDYVMSGTSSGLPLTYTSTPPGIAVIESGRLHILAEGTTIITATQSGDARYFPAIPISRTITVGPPATAGVGNVISFADLPNKTVVDAPFNLTATATSGLPVTYSSSNPAVAEVSGNLVSIKGIGSTIITAFQAGNGNIAAATPIARKLTIDKKSQHIPFYLTSSETFGIQPIDLPISAHEGLPLTYTISDNKIGSIENYRLTIKSAGILTVTASQPGNDTHFPAAPVSQTIRIYPKNDNLYIKPIQQLTYGDPPFELEAWAISGFPVAFKSSDESIASINGSKVNIKGAGSVTVYAVSRHPGYSVTERQSRLVIKKARQVIKFAPLESRKFGDAPFNLTGSVSSGLPISFLTSTPDVVRIEGNRVTIIGNGIAEISAVQDGNSNYEPADIVSHKFPVEDAGNIYELVGTTTNGGPDQSGTVFSMNSEGTAFKYLKQFPARTSPRPRGGFLKGDDGNLYASFREGGTGNAGSIIKTNADGTGFSYLHHFNTSDGAHPEGTLIQATDGKLYGTSREGGMFEGGTMFRIRPDGKEFEVVYHFHALTGKFPNNVIQGNDGRLYGVTSSGGFYNYGTIYSINPDGSEFSIILHKNRDAPVSSGTMRGALVQGPDGFLYATSENGGDYNYGTLFKIKTDGSGYSHIVHFDNINTPSLPGYEISFGSDGRIYGMTGYGGAHQKGTIFAVDLNGSNFVVLHSFIDTDTESRPPGSYPFGKLVEGSDGYLYGTTASGGTYNHGTIFRINKDGSRFETLMNFDERASYPYHGPLVESTPGVFFGMTRDGRSMNGGAIFKFSGHDFTIINELPQEPSSPRNLISDLTGDFYYGITNMGIDGATIFRINASGTLSEQIYAVPAGESISCIFYASTDHLWISGFRGGENFMLRMKPDGSDREDIVSYNNAFSPKQFPVMTMVETSEGEIFGATDSPWSHKPVFFRIKNNGTGFTKLAELGSQLSAGIVHGSDGYFYLADQTGGIFRVTRTGGITNVFVYPYPIEKPQVKALIELNGGRLGAVTKSNNTGDGLKGSDYYGTVFTIEKDGSDFRQIYKFLSKEVASPVDMLQSMDGWLYLLSSHGGVNQDGLIYKFRPDGSSFEKVFEFNGDDGQNPNTILFRRVPQSFSFSGLSEKKTSDPPFSPSIISSSGSPILLSSSNSNVAVIENGRIKPIGVGNTTITASLPANANYYYGGQAEQMLVVTRGNQIINFEELPHIKLEDIVELSASSTSGLPVSYRSSNSEIATISGTTLKIHGYGTTTITASQPGNDNFFAAPDVARVLTVEQGHLIFFSNPGDKVLGDPSFNLNATSSYGLAVSFATSSDKIQIDGSQVTILKPGKVTISATQNGNEEFEPAIPIVVSFCINPPKPMITESGEVPDVTLHSSNETGNEWFVDHETLVGYAQSIFPPKEGTYTVVTTIDGCHSLRSDPTALITTGIEESAKGIKLYPNPTTGLLYIEVPGNTAGLAQLELLDVNGRILASRSALPGSISKFELEGVGTGVIIVMIRMDTRTIVRKILRY